MIDDISLQYKNAMSSIATGEYRKAIVSLKKCITLDKKATDAILLLAKLYIQTSQLKKALTTYTEAKRIGKFRLKSIAGIATTLRLLDKPEQSYNYLIEESKDLSILPPSIAISFANTCIETKKHSEAIDKIKETLNTKTNIPINANKNLLHTLGKLYDGISDFESAFNAHKQANELTQDKYHPEQFESLIASIQTTYNEKFILNALTSKNINTPVFIIGMPRSGSTLLEQILSCHTDIYGAGELYTLQDTITKICIGQYPERMRFLEQKTLNTAASYYIKKSQKNNIKYSIDKMPHNYLHVGVIKQLFPHAKIIHIKRNSIDNCLSIYFQYFNDTHNYATNLSNIAHHFSYYNKLLNYWNKVYPNAIIEIQYEELIKNTKIEISKILKHLDLNWQESCLQHTSNNRHVLTASQQQVNKPIYTKSISRWKNYKPYINKLLSELSRYESL
ncbi:MAG: sulfotransferase [Pseudomonadota bacterium]